VTIEVTSDLRVLGGVMSGDDVGSTRFLSTFWELRAFTTVVDPTVMHDRRYSRAEVAEILRRAAERADDDGGGHVTHQELVEAAAEAGIDVGAIEREAEALTSRRQEDAWVLADAQARKRRFVTHALTYLVIMSGLTALNVLSGTIVPALVVAILWGMGLAMHAISAYRAPSDARIERVVRRGRRRIAKAQAQEARAMTRREVEARLRATVERSKQVDRVIDAGVDALLEGLTRRGRGKARPGEFGRYVDEREAAKTGPKVRVAAEDETDEPSDPDRSRQERRRGR
jgi:2TM domain